jgi:uncharacterized Zn-finger protein
MSITCDFCNKAFFSISNLNRHLKTSKKCLSIQDDDTEEVQYNICQYCNKKFTRKCTLVRHLTTCKYSLVHQHLKTCKCRMLKT